MVVVCIDDPVVRELIPAIGRTVLTYGFSADADYRISEFSQAGTQNQICHHRSSGSELSGAVESGWPA